MSRIRFILCLSLIHISRPSLLDRSTSRELLNSGSSFFLIQVAAVVVFSSDNIVVSHYLRCV